MDRDGNKTELGCLFEATQAGTKDITLPNGSAMKYLLDGDEIVLTAWCAHETGGDVGATLGFGECRGLVLPAFDT